MSEVCPSGSFTHTMLLAASPEALAGEAVPVIQRALSDGASVHVNLSCDRLAALRAGLGPGTAAVSFTDTAKWQAHPLRRLRAIHDVVDEQLAAGTDRLCFLGECAWPEADPVLRAEWERFDAVLNCAFADRPVTMACVYDPAAQSTATIERARASHPYLGLAAPVPCGEYLPPEQVLVTARPDALPVPECAVRLAGPKGAAVRAQLAALLQGPGMGALGGGVDPEVCDALLVATSELVTNSQQAGAATIEIACWREGRWAMVQVDDDGPGLADALAGYRLPPLDALGGRGLWITRQLVDAVDVASGDWGTSVRLRLGCLEGGA
ncbi:MAG: MEDS domain-containing protein [Acidimicrobiales bacterium]